VDDTVQSEYTQIACMKPKNPMTPMKLTLKTARQTEFSRASLNFILISIGMGVFAYSALHSITLSAKNSPQTGIHITLLGQPCLLQGPLDEATLRAIHAIGPAQIYPEISTEDFKSSKEQIRKALKKLHAGTTIPSLLDRYRDKLKKRLEAQVAFFEDFEVAQKKNDPQLLMKSLKRYLKSSDLQQFEKILKKLGAAPKSSSPNSSQNRETIDQAYDFYNDSIEPDPEEEFHRAIKKLDVQYTCSFEENDDLNGE